MKLHEVRNEILVQAQYLTAAHSASERVGAELEIHRLITDELRCEGVVLPCQAGNEPPEETT